jgi:hypothetical protein
METTRWAEADFMDKHGQVTVSFFIILLLLYLFTIATDKKKHHGV